MTNKHKNVLYVGVTNDLERRVYEHETGEAKGFTKKYNCHYLVYYEYFTYIEYAIEREKEIKKWRREKKDMLISSFNPDWHFMNDEIHNLYQAGINEQATFIRNKTQEVTLSFRKSQPER